MHDTGIDLLFPPYVVPSLKYLRGSMWQELIENLMNLNDLTRERLAFIHMMVNLSGCVTCQADSFKAMRGCSQCALVTIKRFRGNDRELIDKYLESLRTINRYIQEDRYGFN